MELGLFWAVHSNAQGNGYATEVASALIEHAFRTMAVDRIIATTEHENLASIQVMRRLGMQIDRYAGVHPDSRAAPPRCRLTWVTSGFSMPNSIPAT